MAKNWYVNNGYRTCPLIPTRFGDNDEPTDGIIIIQHQDSPDPAEVIEFRTTNNLAKLPRDWRTRWQKFSDIEQRGYFYTTTDDYPAHLVDDELAAASSRRDELFFASANENVVESDEPPAGPVYDPRDTNRDGLVDRSEQKEAKRRGK